MAEKKLYAVLGYPISHSLSPKIHQFWLKKYQINANYLSLPVDKNYLADILPSLPKMGFYGVNLTVPLKEIALSLCDELSDAAQKIGAVNTIIFKGKKIYGDNTDAKGFMIALKYKYPAYQSQKAVLIGAGGAARAVLYALLNEKLPEIIIYNRTLARAEQLRDEFSAYYPKTIIKVKKSLENIENIDLIINSSICGMNGENDIDFDFAAYQQSIIAYDLVYKPLQTKFLADAKQAKHHAMNGLDMLLYQAAYAFHLWFGVMPEIDDELRKSIFDAS
ncbi:MAG: shikimate dehydrogenase [Alphaproteobacteria bacterium]|nr:shikimate dehydrogenase [Alphaproteobacteria bacterium]